MIEIWKPVLETNGKYEASNLGRIKRSGPQKDGSPRKPLRQSAGTWGYGYVGYAVDGRHKTRLAHRVIYIAFHGPIPVGMQINHKNGVKLDNRLENLELVTPSQNTKHSFDVLKRAPSIVSNPGEKNGRAKLTEAEVKEIFRLRAGGVSVKEIAKRYGLHKYYVYNLLGGRTWKHVRAD